MDHKVGSQETQAHIENIQSEMQKDPNYSGKHQVQTWIWVRY